MNTKKKEPSRIVIYNGDIILLNGCSEATASRKMQQCREALGKLPHQPITIREYCNYYGLEYNETINHLNLIA